MRLILALALLPFLVVTVLGLVILRPSSAFTGLASDEAVYIANNGASSVNLAGLLLGGIVIGSLGVLNDATVTQASAVWEVHHASPDRPAGATYRSGMRIGRDHIASTVYTIVLAYAGVSLPLLILFTLSNASFGTVVTGEIVAEEIVRTAVGSIGLVLSVPITTIIAALVVTHQDPDAEPRVGPARRARLALGTVGGRSRGAATAISGRTRSAAAEKREHRREAKLEKDRSWEPSRQEREFWDE